MDDPRVDRKGWRLIRRVFPIGFGAILVVTVMCLLVLYTRSQSRYTVLGRTDPASGIRIEYTISSRYIQKVDEEHNLERHNHDAFADWEYTLSSPSPFIRWVDKNILRKSEDELELSASTAISQTSSKHAKMAGWYVDPRGYVSIDLGLSPGRTMAAVSSQEYRMVGDCPTTLIVEDSDLIVNGHPMQYYDLLVRPRGQTVIYVFQATGIEGSSLKPGLGELKSIRESVRGVKAK